MDHSLPKQPSNFVDTENVDFKERLLSAVATDPVDDVVYFFPHPTHQCEGRPDDRWWGSPVYCNIKLTEDPSLYGKCVIAGSAAVGNLGKLLNKADSYNADWSPNDADLFFLGAARPHRLSLGIIDFVYCPEKTVEELLTNFDLPCCRAAISPAGDIWISAQCLASIWTRQYYLPSYMKDRDSFRNVLSQHTIRDDKYAVFAGLLASEDHLFRRFSDRVIKYKKRDFTPIWVKTDKILPWVHQRFHYAEWTTQGTKI